jgi:hypothetical protein
MCPTSALLAIVKLARGCSSVAITGRLVVFESVHHLVTAAVRNVIIGYRRDKFHNVDAHQRHSMLRNCHDGEQNLRLAGGIRQYWLLSYINGGV